MVDSYQSIFDTEYPLTEYQKNLFNPLHHKYEQITSYL